MGTLFYDFRKSSSSFFHARLLLKEGFQYDPLYKVKSSPLLQLSHGTLIISSVGRLQAKRWNSFARADVTEYHILGA